MPSFEEWHEWPDWAKDALLIDTAVQLSWRDRWRALCGRPVRVESKTFLRVVVGDHTTLSRASVAPLWRWRATLGMVEAAPEPPRRDGR